MNFDEWIKTVGVAKGSFSLFPAHAGVIPVQAIMYGVIAAFPRACGGDPALGGGVGSLLGFSPRMRG